MTGADAVHLIADAVPRRVAAWADVGAGTGTFTRALTVVLGAGSRVYSIDKDPVALTALRRLAARSRDIEVIPVGADFTRPFELPRPGDAQLDGILIANALHFVRDAETVLRVLVRLLRAGGRAVIIEYDGRGPNRWVPYPVPIARLPTLAGPVGLSEFTVSATRRSTFGGVMYTGVAERVHNLE